MSFTNTTTHYGLPQYIATDKPKYLTDYNQAMADIDTQMYTNAQAAATADGKAVAAKDIADGAVSSIGTLNTQINGDVSDPSDRGLAGDVSDNSGAINTINSLIGNGTPTTSDKTIIGAINEIYADITGGGTAVQAANVSYDGTTSGLVATSVQGAIDEVAAEVGDLTSLDTTVKTDVVSAINEVAGAKADKITLIGKSGVGDRGTQLANLATLWATLTNEQKARSYIVGSGDGTGVVARCVFVSTGLFSATYDDATYNSVNILNLTVNATTPAYTLAKLDTTNNTWSYSDATTASLADDSLWLYA